MTAKASPTSPEKRDGLDARMRASLVGVAVSGAVLGALAAAFAGAAAAWSVVAGAGLATANLWALARVVVALLPAEPEAEDENRHVAAGQPDPREARAWASVAMLKTVGLLLVAWGILRYRVAAPLPLLVGFGALPIGIAIAALVSDRRPHPRKGL
jgi:hypothetical protein